MTGLTQFLESALLGAGADLVGFGDLTGLPEAARQSMPVGVSVAVAYPKDVIRGIADRPTPRYLELYRQLNARLDGLILRGARLLEERGYAAIAPTKAMLAWDDTDYATALPHKTVATRAGLGWIGKCALLVTQEYGSMVRLSSILTDAPLKTAAPVDTSKCGGCTVCVTGCPAGAVRGVNWSAGMTREDYYDPIACAQTAAERSATIGSDELICGKCIAICPYTRRYLDG